MRFTDTPDLKNILDRLTVRKETNNYKGIQLRDYFCDTMMTILQKSLNLKSVIMRAYNDSLYVGFKTTEVVYTGEDPVVYLYHHDNVFFESLVVREGLDDNSIVQVHDYLLSRGV